MSITTYTIDHTADDLRIAGFETFELATAHPAQEGFERVVIREKDDLGTIGDGLLLRVYNFKKSRGKPVDAIIDEKQKKKIIASTWALLQHKELTSDAEDGTTAPQEGNDASEKENDMASKKRAPTKKAKAAKAATKAKRASTGPRGEKTKKVAALLQRKNGCTAAEVLEATGWPAVSMPAMAKACGLKLTKEKEKGSGKPTRYYGEAKTS